MNDLTNKPDQLTTIFYKYNRFAPVVISIYILAFVTFFIISSSQPAYVTGIGFLLLISVPVYGAIAKKSFFNLRKIDDRKLTLTATHIQIGEQQWPVAELKIALYIGGFQGFRYNKTRTRVAANSIYGHQNYLSFKNPEKKIEDIQFYLRDYKALEALYTVVGAWKAAGVSVTVKEAFTREFVRDQVKRFVSEHKKSNG